jgi:hypothetical protein
MAAEASRSEDRLDILVEIEMLFCPCHRLLVMATGRKNKKRHTERSQQRPPKTRGFASTDSYRRRVRGRYRYQ